MKIAISNIAWEREDQKKILNLLQKYQISGIEIAPTKILSDPAIINTPTIEKYRREVKRCGINIIAFQSLLFNKPELNIFGDKTIREKTFVYLKTIIRLGNVLGAKVFVFGSPKNRIIGSKDKKVAYETAIDFFYHIAEYCQKYKSYFCIEPNSKDYGCDFIVTGQEAYKLVKMVNHPHFRINLDTGIMYLNKEDPIKTIELCFGYLAHIHLSEPYLNSLEDTVIAHKKIAKSLKSLDYNNYVSIEMLTKEKKAPETIEKSLKVVTEHYR